jgi:predicted RecA/RadA family phage recombinase
MNAIRLQEGKKINYTPAAAVDSGAIVDLGEILGVAERAIAASAVGALALEGVFRLIKDGTSGPVFAVGDAVFWDKTAGLATRIGGSSCLYFGTCVEAAGTNQAWVDVKLDPPNLPGELGAMLWEDVTLASADRTLAIADCGKVINVIVGDDAHVVILPAIAAGLDFTVRCGVDGQRLAISPNANDRIMGADIAGTDDHDHILTKATAKKGDFIHLSYGGANGYIIRAARGVWLQA